ncbi:hypothetical protein [Nonomuraea jabiensis]|uniref:hypothetical protein n=1 Tax=Nonomuraea jabiensis TaxID=882448 RepID=UPI003D70921D
MTIPATDEASTTPYASIPEISDAVERMHQAFRPDAPQRHESDLIVNVLHAFRETAAGYEYQRGFSAASERWHQLAATAMQAHEHASSPSDQARLAELARQATEHANRLTARHARAAEHAQPYTTPQEITQQDLQVLHLYRAWRRTAAARTDWTEVRSLIRLQHHGVEGRGRDQHDLSEIHQRCIELADASQALGMLIGTNTYYSSSDRETLKQLTDAATLHAARLAISANDDALSQQFRAAVQTDPAYINTVEHALHFILAQDDHTNEPQPTRQGLADQQPPETAAFSAATSRHALEARIAEVPPWVTDAVAEHSPGKQLPRTTTSSEAQTRSVLEARLIARLLANPDQIALVTELMLDTPAITHPALRVVFHTAVELAQHASPVTWEGVAASSELPERDLNDVKALLEQAAATFQNEGNHVLEDALQLAEDAIRGLAASYAATTLTSDPSVPVPNHAAPPSSPPPGGHPAAYSPSEKGPDAPHHGLSL